MSEARDLGAYMGLRDGWVIMNADGVREIWLTLHERWAPLSLTGRAYSGRRWPSDIHKGQAIRLTIQGETFEGRVVRRRMGLLVLSARAVR